MKDTDSDLLALASGFVRVGVEKEIARRYDLEAVNLSATGIENVPDAIGFLSHAQKCLVKMYVKMGNLNSSDGPILFGAIPDYRDTVMEYPKPVDEVTLLKQIIPQEAWRDFYNFSLGLTEGMKLEGSEGTYLTIRTTLSWVYLECIRQGGHMLMLFNINSFWCDKIACRHAEHMPAELQEVIAA